MGLGRLATQFQAGGRSPVGAEKILAERSRDEQVADLQHLGETSLVCRSKYHPPAARPSSSWESSRHLPYDGAESGCCFFFTQPRWLGYALLANLHRHTRYAGVRICFVGIRKKRSANKVPGRKWCFSNDDPCTCAAKNSILNHPRSLSRPTSYPPEF